MEGKHFAHLHPVMQDNEPIEITSLHFRNGWH